MSGRRLSITRVGFDDENIVTPTSEEQLETENECVQAVQTWLMYRNPAT